MTHDMDYRKDKSNTINGHMNGLTFEARFARVWARTATYFSHAEST